MIGHSQYHSKLMVNGTHNNFNEHWISNGRAFHGIHLDTNRSHHLPHHSDTCLHDDRGSDDNVHV